MSYADARHRPHASHYDEVPTTEFDLGPENLTVTLDTWGPTEFVNEMASYLQANWGEHPLNVADIAPEEAEYWVNQCFQGKTLQQVLEGLSFWFTIDGVTRAATHQIVRTRIGAGFMQHGGRDNDWRHRRFRMPETVRRLIAWVDQCVTLDWRRWQLPDHMHPKGIPLLRVNRNMGAIERYLDHRHTGSLGIAIREHVTRCKELYAALVDAGIPWQDARRFLPIGLETYIHAQYTFPALQSFLSKRLEHVMDWEINCIAQLMLREVKMKCPRLVSQCLGSVSDRSGRAAFAGMESWPPDEKWPVPSELKDLPRTHVPEQNPFWVLHPDSMEGGDIRWIPTNGKYPKTD